MRVSNRERSSSFGVDQHTLMMVLDDGLSIYHECYGRTSSDSPASGRLVHGPESTVGREAPKIVERPGLPSNGNANLRGGRGSFLMISVLR